MHIRIHRTDDEQIAGRPEKLKRIWISSAVLFLLAAGVFGCSLPGPGQRGAGDLATPTNPPDSVPITYRNVSLVAPPFYTNKVTAEELDLREQMNPADAVPGYERIIFQESGDFVIGSGGIRPDSQVLVYPLTDLVQAYPEAAAAAAELQVILGPGDAPLPLQLPFWPLVSYSGVVGAPLQSLGRPALTAHRQYLAFGSGRGIRYVTLLEQDPPRSRRMYGLVYTFQGITTDRLYYVAVVVPVDVQDNSPSRTGTEQLLESLAEQQPPDYAKIAEGLGMVAPDQFFLSLAECDALVRSLVVSP